MRSTIRLNRVQIKENEDERLVLRHHRLITWLSVAFTLGWVFVILISLIFIFADPMSALFLIAFFSPLFTGLALVLPFHVEITFNSRTRLITIQETFLFLFWKKRTHYEIPYGSVVASHFAMNEMHLLTREVRQIELFFGISRKKRELIIARVSEHLKLDSLPPFDYRTYMPPKATVDPNFPFLSGLKLRWIPWAT